MIGGRLVALFRDVRHAVSAARGGRDPGRDLAWIAWLVLWRVCLRALKHVVPLPVLVRAVCRTAAPARGGGALRRQLMSEWFARRSVMLPGNCLERSLLVHATWASASAPTRLVFGFRRRGGSTQGHSWVMSDGALLLEAPGAIEGFQPACSFDPTGARAAAGLL
jgi:hypothetical protein